MQHATLLAHALRPASVTGTLPALVESRSILPGERCEFIFSRSEDIELVQVAMQAGDRRFVHLTRRPGMSADKGKHELAASTASDAVGCVVTIFSARDLPFGRLAVSGLVGPRCRVTNARHEPVASDEVMSFMQQQQQPQQQQPATLLRVTPTLLSDDETPPPSAATKAPDDASSRQLDALRRECVARLLHPACAPLLDAVGLVPPLLCPERLSLFLCGLLLHAEDVDHRLACVHTTSTRERLGFCRDAMRGAWWEALLPGGEEEGMVAVPAAGLGGNDSGNAADGAPADADAGQGVVRPWELPPAKEQEQGASRGGPELEVLGVRE